MLNETTKIKPLYKVNGRSLDLHFHKGQLDAWDSLFRYVVVLAGTQGGKTSFGPFWMHREIQRKGPGDYLVVTPTYKLLNLKALPEFENVFTKLYGLGEYKKSDKVYVFDAIGERRMWGQEQDTPTRILFGFATDPDSLESATAKAAWLDEAGQNKFKLGSFEAVMRRLSLAQGRVLITTTPYNLGWLKQKMWDVKDTDDDIDVIRFDSTLNPSFPQAEMDRARRTLPRWKFDMFYRAIFTRPAGMIYDCFDDDINKIKPFVIPDDWTVYGGFDFGGVNTACLKIAENPDTKQHYVFWQYHEGGLTAGGHARRIQLEYPIAIAYGGAGSEDNWRQEFGAAGLPINRPPIKEVEVGIDRVYGAFKDGSLIVFDNLDKLLDEVGSYAREVDDAGEPTEKIADKNTYHLLDALRYIMSFLAGNESTQLLW